MTKEQALYQENGTDERSELQPELMLIMKEEVGKAREKRMPMIRAFEAVAERSGLKSTTIRNYYYRYLHAQEDMKKEQMMEAQQDLTLEESIGKPFTPQETKELMKEMLRAQAEGESVRGCANRLSGGDKRVLIRLQNKYRSIIAREPEYVEDLMAEMKSEGIPCYNPYTKARSSVRDRGLGHKKELGEESLLEWMGVFVSNMKDIKGVSLLGFMKGLKDLSDLAAGNQRAGIARDGSDPEMQELHNRLLLLEASIDRDQKELRSISNQHRALLEINKRFVRMTDSEKLTGLKGYVEQLQSFIQG